MVADPAKIPTAEEVELMEEEQLRETLKNLITKMNSPTASQQGEEQEEEQDTPPGLEHRTDGQPECVPVTLAPVDRQYEGSEEGVVNKVTAFKDKSLCKPEPWDGEEESQYKAWSERLTSYMAGAGDKVWKKIIRHIGELPEEECLESDEEINSMLSMININTDLKEDLQDMLYDQLTQYTAKELLADVQMGGPRQSMEVLRKAMMHGRKKTAENVHRARNRVTRPDIAENLVQLEEKYRNWKKDIAYLKNIDAYDFKDATMISILLDFIPDSVHNEINLKHETVGKRSSTLKQI